MTTDTGRSEPAGFQDDRRESLRNQSSWEKEFSEWQKRISEKTSWEKEVTQSLLSSVMHLLIVGYDDWSQISDCHNNMGVPWPWQRSGDIIVTHLRTFLRILQKPDTVCTVSSDDLKRMMPQKLIFDGPGSGDESTRWADGMITIKLISISKLPGAIKPDTQERGLRESVQKWGKINL